MRIAMLGVKGVPTIGGIARYVEEVGSRLVERGHEVTVYCRPHFMEGEGDYRGMRRIVTGGLRGKHLDALTHTFTATMHALRQDYDIAHIHGSAPGVIAPIIRLLSRQRVLLTLHGLDWRAAKWGSVASTLVRFGGRVAAAGAHSRTAVSQSLQHEYCETFPGSVAVAQTGVNFPELADAEEITDLGLAPGGYAFCAARLMPEKGIHHLVDAFEQIDTDKTLVIAGDSPYEDAYSEALLARASEKVRFVGYVTGRLLAELYSNACVYVQPSEIEGLSVSVLEALSYGRCVLASDIAPNVEALDGCGYTFRSGDVADLRDTLAELLEAPELVAEQFELTRRYIREKRNWDRTVDAYETLYQELLAGRGVLSAAPVAVSSCAGSNRS